MIDEELLKARDDAWVKWSDFMYGDYYTHWYRHVGKGQKGKINPWKSLDELRAAMKAKDQLFQTYLEYSFECHRRGLPNIAWDLLDRWYKTTDQKGRDRYVKRRT